MFSSFVIQFIGIVAWLFLVVSYWKDKVNTILILQVISCLLFALHYYLLGAMSGLYVVLFEAIRDFIYYKSLNDRKIFFCSIPIYIFMAIYNFTGIMSMLPVAASLIDGFSLTEGKMLAVIGGIISYSIWFIYDLSCFSYAGAFSNITLIVSNIFVLTRLIENRRKV